MRGSYKVHELVHLERALPGTVETVDITGVVRWRQDRTIGVEFMRIERQSRKSHRGPLSPSPWPPSAEPGVNR